MVVLSFSEAMDVTLRIIMLEIIRIRSLMTKAIVSQTYHRFSDRLIS